MLLGVIWGMEVKEKADEEVPISKTLGIAIGVVAMIAKTGGEEETIQKSMNVNFVA